LNALCYNSFENKGHLERFPYTFISNEISDLIKMTNYLLSFNALPKKHNSLIKENLVKP
jgi:hypothetical protein